MLLQLLQLNFIRPFKIFAIYFRHVYDERPYLSYDYMIYILNCQDTYYDKGANKVVFDWTIYYLYWKYHPFPLLYFRQRIVLPKKKNCSQNDEFTIHIWNENPIDISGKIILYLVIFRKKAIVTKKDKPLNVTKNQ